MNDHERIIVACVLQSVEEMTPRERAIHYQALARLTSSDDVVAQLIALAAQCEALDRDCKQLSLDFKRRAQS
jgi:hypothetical protein